MGMARITVVVVGNHGCQRDKKGSDVLEQCGNPTCVDCAAREMVARLRAGGNNVQEAHVHHWPSAGLPTPAGNAGDVVDNLLSERRLGSFNA